MKFLIKICGVTTPGDAAFASEQGAGAIGMNFWPGSKRFLPEDRAIEVVRAIPPGVLKVGVFVNAHPLVVSETIAELGLDRVQLHGNERAGGFPDLETGKIIRAIRVRDQGSLREAWAWEAALFLYEGLNPGFGGTGTTAPWELIARGARRPFLLAGGLTPENVASAILATRPEGVDVASGVEISPGIKDLEKVRAFIRSAQAAAGELTDPDH